MSARALRTARERTWLLQVALFAGAYLLYSAGRWLAGGDYDQAVATAHDLLALERSLSLDVEAAVQDALDVPLVVSFLNWSYLAAQVAVLPVALAICWRLERDVYRRLRDGVLISWLMALPVYALLPVAPPRLAGVGLTDTISGRGVIGLDSRLATSFYNPIAAVPSLHAGFALAVSLALWRVGTGRATGLRAIALTWTPLIVVAVVATGNHFVLDIVAGLAVAGVADRLAGRRALRARAGGWSGWSPADRPAT